MSVLEDAMKSYCLCWSMCWSRSVRVAALELDITTMDGWLGLLRSDSNLTPSA